jgi:hypothetical protein
LDEQISVLDGGEWSDSGPSRFNLVKITHGYILDRRLVGPIAGLEAVEKTKLL